MAHSPLDNRVYPLWAIRAWRLRLARMGAISDLPLDGAAAEFERGQTILSALEEILQLQP